MDLNELLQHDPATINTLGGAIVMLVNTLITLWITRRRKGSR